MENKLPWWEGLDFRFIRLPVELLDRGLSPAAMVLYGVLLGRLSLSGKKSRCITPRMTMPWEKTATLPPS